MGQTNICGLPHSPQETYLAGVVEVVAGALDVGVEFIVPFECFLLR